MCSVHFQNNFKLKRRSRPDYAKTVLHHHYLSEFFISGMECLISSLYLHHTSTLPAQYFIKVTRLGWILNSYPFVAWVICVTILRNLYYLRIFSNLTIDLVLTMHYANVCKLATSSLSPWGFYLLIEELITSVDLHHTSVLPAQYPTNGTRFEPWFINFGCNWLYYDFKRHYFNFKSYSIYH